jgi:hypothetical protein
VLRLLPICEAKTTGNALVTERLWSLRPDEPSNPLTDCHLQPVYALAKELLEMETTGDCARAEAWFRKYDRMPPELKTAFAATLDIPVDINPVFSLPDKVR